MPSLKRDLPINTLASSQIPESIKSCNVCAPPSIMTEFILCLNNLLQNVNKTIVFLTKFNNEGISQFYDPDNGVQLIKNNIRTIRRKLRRMICLIVISQPHLITSIRIHNINFSVSVPV